MDEMLTPFSLIGKNSLYVYIHSMHQSNSLPMKNTVLAVLWPHSQAMNCTLGSENMDQLTRSDPSAGLYLDTSSTAECDGNITSWSLCYYEIRVFSTPYQVEFQVWRRLSNDEYHMVGAAVQTLTVSFRDDEFNCRHFVLSESEWIQIERDDFIGVHLMDSTELTVLGETGDSQDSLLYTDQVSSATLQSSSFTRDDGIKMHISATIGKIIRLCKNLQIKI